MKSYLPTLLLAILTSASTLAHAADAPNAVAIAREVDRHYNHLSTLQTQFSETYRGNGVAREESGTLWLKKPGKMRWEYRSPREKLFLGDGKDAWFYVPGDRQVRRTPMRKLDDLRSPLSLLLGKTKLENELRGLSLAKDAPANPVDAVLQGVPKGMESQVTRVTLEVTPGHQIAGISIAEVDGSVTEYRFSEQQENVPVPEEKFQFVLQPGVEVIDGNFGP